MACSVSRRVRSRNDVSDASHDAQDVHVFYLAVCLEWPLFHDSFWQVFFALRTVLFDDLTDYDLVDKNYFLKQEIQVSFA